MGGNALAETCRRHDKDEYYAKEEEILFALRGLFPNTRIYPIKAYKTKDSFGDCDILLQNFGLGDNWIELISEVFASKQVIKNGNVCSFEYYGLQVDIIVTKPEDFISSCQYFDYNDLGNLIGRVAHKLGLKLGHDGLSYKWRLSDTHVFKEIVLLKDWKDILPVLGYSYERYYEGFNDIEDIYEFVVSSRFFNKAIYQLDNRNHTSRVRDKKRKTYMGFLQWIENYEETEQQLGQKGINKKDFLPYLMLSMPDFGYQYQEIQKEYDRQEEFKKRFNGDLVKEWTGISGKDLGNFMKWFKALYPPERLQKDVITMNPVLVERWTRYWVAKWQKEG